MLGKLPHAELENNLDCCEKEYLKKDYSVGKCLDWLLIPSAKHIFLYFCNYIIASYCGTIDK